MLLDVVDGGVFSYVFGPRFDDERVVFVILHAVDDGLDCNWFFMVDMRNPSESHACPY